MFRRLIHDWFGPASADYNDFLPALLDGDVEAMNAYMNRITLETFSFFDAGKNQRSASTMASFWDFWWSCPAVTASPPTGKAASAAMISAWSRSPRRMMPSS